ncbi:hypothetical protein LTR94_034828, partial [Friedmanniomyces endolithicus]
MATVTEIKSDAQETGAWLGSNIWDGRAFDGDWTPLQTSANVLEPATGAVLGSVGLASPEDIRAAAVAAKSAQKSWAATGYDERAAILRAAAAVAEKYRAEIVDWI